MLDFIIANQDKIFIFLAGMATVLPILIRLLQHKISLREALLLMANTLKDEEKMVNNGFSKETFEKLQGVAEVAGNGIQAVEEAKQALEKTEGGKGTVKVGSYKKKPIYIEDVLRVAGKIKALFF